MRVPELISDGNDDDGRVPYADLHALSDERVMEELRVGNTDAFAVIFNRFHRLVHVTALRILKDASEAEDITQGVFFEVYRKAGQFDPARGTLKMWLLQYAYSRSISRRSYLQVRQLQPADEAENVEESATLWPSMRPPSQDTALLTDQILAALPEAQRETITMFFFQGLSLREIAERRHETFSNVRHHYYRGLKQLREFLENGVERKDARPGMSFSEVRRAES
jgi:RNA polymerase sigma-70 factor, ECF subfamily